MKKSVLFEILEISIESMFTKVCHCTVALIGGSRIEDRGISTHCITVGPMGLAGIFSILVLFECDLTSKVLERHGQLMFTRDLPLRLLDWLVEEAVDDAAALAEQKEDKNKRS